MPRTRADAPPPNGPNGMELKCFFNYERRERHEIMKTAFVFFVPFVVTVLVVGRARVRDLLKNSCHNRQEVIMAIFPVI